MFSAESINAVVRFVKFFAWLAVAALVVWRGNAYRDPAGATVLPTAMCAVGALFVALTGMVMFWSADDDAERMEGD